MNGEGDPGSEAVADLGSVATESVRVELAELDLLSSAELVALLVGDARRATSAVAAATGSITRAVELVRDRLASGGRLVYVGAGTAGRLATLDAAELGPTFSVPAGRVEAVLAGGDRALRRAVEGAEDDEGAGASAMDDIKVGPDDVVVGISASGRTPFVVGALEHAGTLGAGTVAMVCNPQSRLAAHADIAVELLVGGEVLAGSSRMNAGTAQKIALNAISTAAMVLLGKTYGNLMVDLDPTNAKLRDRAIRIVAAVTGTDPARASQALERAEWHVKPACLLAAGAADLAAADSALAAAKGRLREALGIVATATGSSMDRTRTARGRWRRLGVSAALVDGVLLRGDVALEGGTVAAVGLPGRGTGLAVPGLVDLQVNGYAGIDASAASTEELVAMGLALARDGVLAYQPTLISDEKEVTIAAAGRIAAVTELATRGATVLGIHLEGPFLSPYRAGVHPPERLREPDLKLLQLLCRSGPVTMVTIAPELPGALELIGWMVAAGYVVSLGHSAAGAAESRAAIEAGASAVTHLYNAMPAVSSRDPGLVGTALSDERLAIQLIADGGHVADELLRLAFAAAPSRCSIVTDATSLAGVGDAELTLGGVPIRVVGGVARDPEGKIAGGASSMLQGLRHLASLSVSLAEVLVAATERPARLLGREDVGHLRDGSPANLIVLDDDLELRDVFVSGEALEPI